MNAKEHLVVDTALTMLHQTTGLNARLLREAGSHSRIIQVGAGHEYRFSAEIQTVDRFETPAMIKARSKDFPKPPLLVAPYITREIAERCRNLRLPFIDTAGNAYLEAPGLLIYVVGHPRPTAGKEVRFRALTPAGLQVTFALLCRPHLIRANYREIAAAARVSLGTVGPAVKDLEARGFLHIAPANERRLLASENLLQEWVTHYPITLRPKLNPRRFQAEAKQLHHGKIDGHNAYWGGEAAAEKLTHFLKPATFTIYAREAIAKVVTAYRMRADPAGNVEILHAFWGFHAAPDPVGIVPPVLAYADLLATNDGRNVEAAKLIYEQRIAPTFRQTP
jgi:hypothetical protein